jgi:hypothetical protein
MINHFRTTVMNLSSTGTATDYIAAGFVSVVLPAELQSFYSLIFPTIVRAEKLAYMTAYTCLLSASNVADAMTSSDPRINYRLDELPDSVDIDLAARAEAVINGTSTVLAMMTYAGTVNNKYRDMYLYANSDLTKLAAAIAAYSEKVA